MDFKILVVLALTILVGTSARLTENDIEESSGPKDSRLYDLDLDILGSDYFDDDSNPSSTVTNIGIPVEEPLVEKKVAPCMGCPNEVNAEDPKIMDMANFAFEEYMTSDDGQSDVAQSFVRVIKASTQVVAGIKYVMEVELGWTNCSKAEYEADPTDCVLDPTKDTFTCDFHVVEQSWLSKKEVVQSKCYRDTSPPPEILADEDSLAMTTEELTDPPETFVAQDDEPFQRRKRAAPQTTQKPSNNLGKIKDADEDKAVIMEMATFAVGELDRVDEDNQARLVLDILHAKKQTVSGWLYHLKVRVAQTSCEEGSDISYSNCKSKLILPFQVCDIKVLFQPWQTIQKKVVQSQCLPEKYKTSKKLAKQMFKEDKKLSFERGSDPPKKIGGSIVIDPNTEDLSELINFALDSVDAESNALHAQKLVRVVHAERQLVSGIRTKMILEVGYTECRKSPSLDKSQCSIDESRDHQFCTITIVEKPWQKEKKMVGSKCGAQNEVPESRTKRGINMFDVSNPEPLDDVREFGKFIAKFERKYDSEEEYRLRFKIFKDNMRKVKLLQDNEQGTATYGATQFADLTEEEFSQRHLGLRPDLRIRMKRKQAKIPALPKIPDEFDWRHFNAVTPVKNQGMCGSCWAFSVTGNIEGAYKIKHGDLLSFSEQELVDCDTLDQGCNGGLPENAYKALEKMGGLELETEYPYDGKGETCAFKSDLAKAKVTGFVEVSKNETEMQAWLLKNGPISIGINANAMQFYFGGVSHPWKYLCSPKNLDHGVLIVGYGVHTTSIRHKTMPYWLIKNSWGPGWGEQGYYRVFRGDGTCGVNQMATAAYVA